jgi:hypothetical protein
MAMELPPIMSTRSIVGNNRMNTNLLSPTTRSPLNNSPSLNQLNSFAKPRMSDYRTLANSPSDGNMNLLKTSPSE